MFPFFLDQVFYENQYSIYDSFLWQFLDIIVKSFWELSWFIYLVIVICWWIFFYYFPLKRIFFENKKKYLLILLFLTFLIFSPFFYERWLTQPNVLISAIYIWLWLLLLQRQSPIDLIYVWLSFSIALMARPHSLFMILLIYIVWAIIYLRKVKQLKYLILSWFIILLTNSNRIFSAITWNNNTLSKTVEIDKTNIEVFQITNLDGLGSELTWLLQYWFWWERAGHILVPWEVYQYRWIWGIIIVFCCMVWWLILLWGTKTRKRGLFVAILWVLSWVLWVWVWSDIRWSVIWRMWDNIPLYNGMRDSQKRIWMLMISQLVWWIVFWKYIILKIEDHHVLWKNNTMLNWMIVLLSLLLLHIRNPHMPQAIWNQILWTNRPQEYYEFKDYLSNHKGDGNILIMPWHSYVACEWTNKKIIPLVLDKFIWDSRLIRSDNIEAFHLYSNSTNPRSVDIELWRKDMKNFSILKKWDIEFILLIDDCSFEWEREELLNEFENSDILLKKRKNWALNLYFIDL